MPLTQQQKQAKRRKPVPTKSQVSANSTQGRLEERTSSKSEPRLPLEVQQSVLDVFKTAFPIAQNRSKLTATIQEVKGHLYNRDFNLAFQKQEYLGAYALRWSAARALAYTEIFADRLYLLELASPQSHPAIDILDVSSSLPKKEQTVSSRDGDIRRVVCIGGGAGAELVGIVTAFQMTKPVDLLDITAIDFADWSNPLADLFSAMVRARTSRETSATDQTSVSSVSLAHEDALSLSDRTLSTFQHTSLCTIMFTLNELFTTSLAKTTTFLLRVTEFMPPSSYLLVVDSPGSYSEINLGTAKQADNVVANSKPATKKYPMKWLLDHTLLEVAGQGDDSKWEKVEEHDSLWFRISDEDRKALRYPIELENMRYQLHLYRRM